jgi:hypothetical protein
MLPLRYGLKQAAKAVMQERIGRGEAEAEILIAASALADAEWEDAHEFRLDGQMYDVAGIEYHSGRKYFRCVADALETRMEHTADDVAFHLSGFGRNTAREQIAKALADWLQGLYSHPPPNLRSLCFVPGIAAGQYFIASGEATEDPFLRNIIIPPEA